PIARFSCDPTCITDRLAAKMKPEQDDRLEAGGDLGWPREFEKLQPPEIVGRVDDPVLEAGVVCHGGGSTVSAVSLSSCGCGIFDRVHGPEPPTPADLEREADYEPLVRAFPAMAETIEPA